MPWPQEGPRNMFTWSYVLVKLAENAIYVIIHASYDFFKMRIVKNRTYQNSGVLKSQTYSGANSGRISG